ncbi:MAG: TetR family transcriptional regulator [Pseudomonadales bacterium]|nr:TetR family transcriptional regulator [Pseudomonadales bacterium]
MAENSVLNYRGRKTSRARSEQRRRAILEAALRIVVRDGVRGVRHRAVAREAGVPLSATTYYFDDISALIADTFTLFAETAIREVVQPIYQYLADWIHQHQQEMQGAIVSDQLLDELAALIVNLVQQELTENRQHLLAEQAFKHECLRDAGLRAVAQTYFDHLLEGLVALCRHIQVDDPDTAGELLMGTVFRIEHEALMVPVEDFDAAKARRMIRRLLAGFLPIAGPLPRN